MAGSDVVTGPCLSLSQPNGGMQSRHRCHSVVLESPDLRRGHVPCVVHRRHHQTAARRPSQASLLSSFGRCGANYTGRPCWLTRDCVFVRSNAAAPISSTPDNPAGRLETERECVCVRVCVRVRVYSLLTSVCLHALIECATKSLQGCYGGACGSYQVMHLAICRSTLHSHVARLAIPASTRTGIEVDVA